MQGGNIGCTFIGEAIQFAPTWNGVVQNNKFTVYTIVGSQFSIVNGVQQTVTNLKNAYPTVLQLPGDTNATQTREAYTLQDLTIQAMNYSPTATPQSPLPPTLHTSISLILPPVVYITH